MKLKALLSSLLLLLAFTATAQDTVFTEPVGLVNDFEGILTNAQEKELTAILNTFLTSGTGAIVVATIPNIGTYTDFDQYSLDLSNHWGVGNKDKDNGLTIIVSSSLRKVRITTGTGTQLILSDAFCNDVVQNNMLPHFKQAEYYEGIKEAVEKIITKWQE